MELAAGCMFDYLINQDKDLPMEVIVDWSLQLANGMNYIQSKDLMHCDLKSKNILLTIYLQTAINSVMKLYVGV